jgi:predicted ester cyclase
VNRGEHASGNTSFDYTALSNKDAELARHDLVETKGFFILPSELFQNVRRHAASDENLNETLQRIFRHIESSAQGSASEADFKGRDGFVAQVGGFGKLIPDLKWDIKEVMVDGNRIIVRSEASGTPVGPFFGVPPSGKTFKIMTIDIHTIKDGKAITAHHVEDWAGALRQLSAK